MTSNHSNINAQTKSNTVNKLKEHIQYAQNFILDYSYKMFKINLKRKTHQEASSLITYRQIIVQSDKLSMKALITINVNYKQKGKY